MKAPRRALAAGKHPALVVGPGVDRAEAVDSMVRRRREDTGAGAGSARFRRAAAFRNGIRNSRVSCTPRRGSSRRRCAAHDLVVVIGAPVFTFHVEGHASIFDGGTPIFQITDDPDAAAVTPRRHQHHRHHQAGADGAAGTAARDQARAAGAADPAAGAGAGRSDSGGLPAAHAGRGDARRRRAGRGSALASPGDAKFMPMRGQDSFYTMASGGLGHSLPAAVGMALAHRPSGPSA